MSLLYYRSRSFIAIALAGALFLQFFPAGVFAANEEEDERFDEINQILNEPEMSRWLLDASKFSSLERRNFLNKNAFILGNFVFELGLLKNKLLELEKSQRGVNEVAALQTHAAITNIDNMLKITTNNRTLADIIAEKKKRAEMPNPHVNDILRDETLLLEIMKEIHIPRLSSIPDLFSNQTDKAAAKKSLELLFAYLNEKIAYILETLNMVEERANPETDEAPPSGSPELPIPPKSPGAAVKNITFTLRMSARTVDAAVKIAGGSAPARRLKVFSFNGVTVTPEIKDSNFYINISGGTLSPDSVSVDVGEGLFDAIGNFFFGGIEPEISGNAFSFALDANALRRKSLVFTFVVKIKPEDIAKAAGVAHEQALLGALWSDIDGSVNRLADLAKKLKAEIEK